MWTDVLYLPRQGSERGLLQSRQTVEEEKRPLNDYMKTKQHKTCSESNR